MQILLVEDHEESARAMSKMLSMKDYSVEVALNCEEAERAFATQSFDLVILDIALPDGDGCDLLKKFVQVHPVKSIAITGYTMYENFERIKAAGFDRCLAKPCGAEVIYSIIDGLVRPS